MEDKTRNKLLISLLTAEDVEEIVRIADDLMPKNETETPIFKERYPTKESYFSAVLDNFSKEKLNISKIRNANGTFFA